jgi:hypothetical protein
LASSARDGWDPVRPRALKGTWRHGTDTNNLAPRVGVAWRTWGETVLRGGYASATTAPGTTPSRDSLRRRIRSAVRG